MAFLNVKIMHVYGRYQYCIENINDVTVDSHHTNFSILPARRAGTHASIQYR